VLWADAECVLRGPPRASEGWESGIEERVSGSSIWNGAETEARTPDRGQQYEYALS
jgi:hypothetical protein